MYSCYSRVNFYLCLSWHSSLFRVESQSCSLWLLPKEGKKRANNMALWGKNKKQKDLKEMEDAVESLQEPDAIIFIERYLFLLRVAFQ